MSTGKILLKPVIKGKVQLVHDHTLIVTFLLLLYLTDRSKWSPGARSPSWNLSKL